MPPTRLPADGPALERFSCVLVGNPRLVQNPPEEVDVAHQRTDIDVIDELVTDHREALQLLGRIASSTDVDERRELADTVISEVVRHSVVEEMYVYPAMREYLPDGEQAVKHDTEEHQELEQVMKQLEGVQAAEPRFDALIQEMTDKLRHHAQDEETEQFPQLRERVPRNELIKLREKVDSAKKLAPTRPHPGAPHSELFHKIVGPGVGMVDRLRDKLTSRPH
jgi:hemerythrin-like domain-containing protein